MSELDRKAKEDMDYWLNRLITYTLSHRRDAGFTGCSMMANVIDFLGCPARSTIPPHMSMTMINAAESLEDKPQQITEMHSAVIYLLFNEKEAMEALIAKHHLQGLNTSTDRAYTNDDRAAEVGQKTADYLYNIRKGYKVLFEELNRSKFYANYYNAAA